MAVRGWGSITRTSGTGTSTPGDGYDPKEGAADAVLSKISDICISMKASDYLQLPDCIVHDIPVELDTKAKKAYNELERKMVLSLPDGDIDVASAAALSNKLQQLANGALYDEDHVVHQVHNCKIEAFLTGSMPWCFTTLNMTRTGF